MTQHRCIHETPLIIYDSADNNFNAGEGQCDCACAATVPVNKPSFPNMINGRYKLTESFQTYPLVDGYHLAVTQRTKPVVFNQAALKIASLFQTPQPINKPPSQWNDTWGQKIVAACISELVNLQMLVPETDNFPSLEEHPEILTAWLHITDRCNLRCDYCYLPHERKDMPISTGKAAIEATFRSAIQHRYRQVKFKYAGGEPLIRFSSIIALHAHAQKIAQQHQMLLDGVILSNGTLLTSDMVEQIQTLGLRLMISLDGLGRFHDQQRIFSGGHGSFEDVAHGIETALDMGLVPDISVTVSGRNVAGLPDLVSWLLQHELPFSLNFYRENELSASYQDLIGEEEEIIAGMLSAFEVIEEQLPRHNLLASLIDRANLAIPHLHTCGVGHSYLVFDHHGRVSKCQMHQTHPITTVEADDPLSLIRTDRINIQNVSVEEKEGCRQCEWKYWCAGGCPLATFRATGRFDVQSPNCHIYKALYPAAIRLEGLRLLKYNLGTEA